ncbi:hypothetical protein [Clostridium sp.]|uniref:hypothetical protein n=1 Tax=Clostridium sp. TaxID=1506 RepID=UPI001A54DBD5|nr:hypothetical protein [Clostridium sp.]MBK5234057.1 hypothetical protein [Clostridium sp.]
MADEIDVVFGTSAFSLDTTFENTGLDVATEIKPLIVTQDYMALTSKPKLNGVELIGNLSNDDIGILQSDFEEIDSSKSSFIKNKLESITNIDILSLF